MLTLIGDISFNGIISDQPEKNTDRFSEVSSLLENDVVIANLESPVKSGDTPNEKKNRVYSADPEVTRCLLKKLKVSCVSLANNHIFDYKMDGLKATIHLLDAEGIHHTGAGWLKEHLEPVIIENKGSRIGFIAFVDPKTNPKTEYCNDLLLNYFDINTVVKTIDQLKMSADKIICSIHWGDDYSYYPTRVQVDYALTIIKAGADIVMGHHPHTLQPYEKIGPDKYIFFSLGGLCYGDDYWEGNLRSLKFRTKNSVITKISNDFRNEEFIHIRELKGNFLITRKGDYRRWSKVKWFSFHVIEIIPGFRHFLDIYNKYLLKTFDFFFGYYRNPVIAIKEILKLRKKI